MRPQIDSGLELLRVEHGLLVELCVLDRDGRLIREGAQQPALVLLEHPLGRARDREKPRHRIERLERRHDDRTAAEIGELVIRPEAQVRQPLVDVAVVRLDGEPVAVVVA